MEAKISEIFCSLQGEGIYQGEKQIFIRFFGCDLDCAFCDEKHKEAGEDISREDLIDKVKSLSNFSKTVSLTGGEPLLQIDFLKDTLPFLKANKFMIYLESNGTLPENLRKVIEWIDVIAMDIKLPSSTGMKSFWREHKEFLKVAKIKRVFVKVVVTNKTKTEEVKKAASIVTTVERSIPLVLQPVTPQNGIESPQKEPLLDFKRRLALNFTNVRIIPQLHRIWGVD